MNESALVHLADQFHIMGNEGWLQAKTTAEKREIIKNAIELHRYKGTKYALIKVLNSLNIDGEIKEWFEYDGEPYFFKVILYIFTRPVDTETEARREIDFAIYHNRHINLSVVRNPKTSGNYI